MKYSGKASVETRDPYWYDKCDHCRVIVGETNLVTVSNDPESPHYGKAVCPTCEPVFFPV